MSAEADILPFNDDDESKADKVDGLLGEASHFSEKYGIYADGVSPWTSMPEGWDERLVRIEDPESGAVGLCLYPEDLCVAKVLAGRSKDIRFLTAEFQAGLVDPDAVTRRVPGFDLTFSVPKSVSVLAVLRPELSEMIVDACESAVSRSIAWLEDNACFSRRGHNGVEHVDGDGYVAASASSGGRRIPIARNVRSALDRTSAERAFGATSGEPNRPNRLVARWAAPRVCSTDDEAVVVARSVRAECFDICVG